MIVVTYRNLEETGVRYLPCKTEGEAKILANKFYKRGFLNVQVVKLQQEVVYSPI